MLSAVIGVTILRIRQLIWMHLFVGLLLMGPVVLKMASTGYRFTRYYMHDPAYLRKGPPPLELRAIAPMVVLSTIVVFVSGILLMFAGPSGRGELLSIHKVSFIVWLVLTGLHVLGHLAGLPDSLRAGRATAGSTAFSDGGVGRAIVLAGSLVGGLVLAIVLIPQFASWTAHGALLRHH